MSATNQTEDDLLDLMFTNVDAPNWGDAGGLRGSLTAGSLFISLHTATLNDTHTAQTQSEAAYTNYARQGVARSVAGWTVAAGNVDNDAAITFPQAASGPETETDVGIGFAATLAGYLHIYSALVSPLTVNSGVTPEFAIGALDVSLD